MPERLQAVVRGRVQGVGFRDFVERRALGLGLTGAVRNRPDGAVEVVAEGGRAQLETLVQELQTGPRMASVAGVETEWSAATGKYTRFRVTS